MPKLFVWDLHGTLEQGNEAAVIELSNTVLEQHGYAERFTEQDALRLYGRKWYEYFEDLLPELPHEAHVQLQEDSFRLSNDSPEVIARHMQPSAHAFEVLAAIKQAGHKQIVISSTTPESLPLYLKALHMENYFDANHAFAVQAHRREVKQTKLDMLQQYLKHRSFEQVIVIGDADSDMLLAEAVQATGYLYAHSGYEFRSKRGRHRINDLRDVLQEIT